MTSPGSLQLENLPSRYSAVRNLNIDRQVTSGWFYWERIDHILPLSVNFVVILPLIQGGEDGLLAARLSAAVPRGVGPPPLAATDRIKLDRIVE